MKNFKIATWNVNSLRVRLPHVLNWLDTVRPDVLALQETKTPDQNFPVESIQKAGYTIIFSGQKTYNGVAILSREKMTEIITDFPQFNNQERRLLAVTTYGFRIINLYVPNGESVSSVKYQYKLNWLKILDTFIQHELKQFSHLIILGDFNIAPDEIDVHNPLFWEGQVLFSEPERLAFRELLHVGFVDCFRQLNPTEKNFTWWDYRLNAFKRNMGLRLDHILASSALSSRCIKCHVDRTPRTWERPSDHAPVIAEFK